MENLISPLDDRYRLKVEHFSKIFNESNLNRTRALIEIEWLIYLCSTIKAPFPIISKTSIQKFRKIYQEFDTKDARRIKQIEKTTNHDVKAIEYFVRQKISKDKTCLLYTSPSPRDATLSRMPSSA